MLGTVANRNRTGASGDILTSPNAPNYLRNTLSALIAAGSVARLRAASAEPLR